MLGMRHWSVSQSVSQTCMPKGSLQGRRQNDMNDSITLLYKCSKWHEALVMAIFEKGDAALCENYRPLTVVSAGYELFAMMLLTRLQIAGAEERIWPTQFAFRSKRGGIDAIFVTRRTVGLTLADRDGTLVLLALDWSIERKPSIR